MREKTVIALFDGFEEAKLAVEDIVKTGIAKDRISLLANDAAGRHPALLSNPAYAREELEKNESDATSGLGIGAEIGAGVGGFLGYLVSIGTIAIPGIGPVIAAGAWIAVAAGVGAGAVVGGAIGALTDRGISREDAHLYAEGLRRGGTLVSVHAAEDQVEKLTDIFRKRGAVDIEQRRAEWRAEGWVSFDPEARPLSAAEIAALREKDTARTVEHHHHTEHHYFKPESGTSPEHLAGVTSKPAPRYAEDETA